MGPAETIFLVFGLIVLALFLLPTIVAISRRHRNAFAVAVLNVLLGWTFVGWVWAMVWAVMATEQRPSQKLDLGAELRRRAGLVR